MATTPTAKKTAAKKIAAKAALAKKVAAKKVAAKAALAKKIAARKLAAKKIAAKTAGPKGIATRGGIPRSMKGRLLWKQEAEAGKLIEAIERKWGYSVDNYLRCGVDVNHRFKVQHVHGCVDGLTPLAFAVYGGWSEGIELLLKHGANIEQGTFCSPLAYAIFLDKRDIAQLLIKHGAKFDGALSNAVHYGRPEGLAMLLKAGADPNAIVSVYERRVFFEAIEKKQVECVKVLLQHGASLEGTDKKGRDVWQIATEAGPEMKAMLEKHALLSSLPEKETVPCAKCGRVHRGRCRIM